MNEWTSRPCCRSVHSINPPRSLSCSNHHKNKRELIQPYEEALRQARQVGLAIEQLSQQADWIERETCTLRTTLEIKQ